MKRIIVWLLIFALLLSGCRGETAAEPQAAVTEAAPLETAAAPTTEPTMSPEERLYESLTEKLRQAVDLGIVELELLAEPQRICSGREAAQMLQKARILKRDEESLVLSQVQDSVHANIQVTRYWMAQMMYAAEMEFFAGPGPEEYLDNLQYLTGEVHYFSEDVPREVSAHFHRPMWIVSENYGVVSHTSMKMDRFDQWTDQDAVIGHGYVTGVADFLEGSWEIEEKPEDWVKYVDYGSPESMSFALMFYDRTTGEKLMPWNETMEIRPREKMTVEAAVEAALRYYNYFPEEPEMLAYADIPAYDKTIITDELLSKQTALPEASCQYLPAEWKGVEVRDLLYSGGVDAKVDANLYESEIQLIKDAGFNYVRLLFNFQYLMSEIPDLYYIFSDKPQEGSMNETHLKALDQIIAWCMERDIHVNLCCTDVVGWSDRAIPDAILAKTQNARPMAEQWQVLARRYADIPNTYLSFTLYDDPPIWQDNGFGKFFGSVVEAIREVSPDRCIIADLSLKSTGESMAQLGVALSARVVLPDEIIKIDPRMKRAAMDQLFADVQWPFAYRGKVYDGEAAMTTYENWITSAPDDVAAVAEQYGVGFMVSSWAPDVGYGNSVRRERFTDEMLHSYLQDFAGTLKERGYGWCYGNWFGFAGFGASYPAIHSTTYTKINNMPLYVDEETFAWLQEINGVS